jgi:AbiV family abortive infection protein
MELSVESLANAEQFLKDSKFLIENDSYDHACSLAILGFEELAKVWCTYYLYLGIYQEKDKEINS